MWHLTRYNTGCWMVALVATLALLVTPALYAQQEDADSGAHDTSRTTSAAASQKEAAPKDASKAQETANTSAGSAQTRPASGDDDSAAKVMDALVEQMKKNPMIEPSDAPAGKKTGTAVNPDKNPGYQPVRVGVDPNIVGTAPGMKGKAPQLRREGEFIISRKGRLVRSDDGLHTLFVFDADSKESPEAPMAMVPCQMLQSMEDLVGQRGDQIHFIVSGQILVYRGVNYLLPTMMTLAQDRGNLQ